MRIVLVHSAGGITKVSDAPIEVDGFHNLESNKVSASAPEATYSSDPERRQDKSLVANRYSLGITTGIVAATVDHLGRVRWD